MEAKMGKRGGQKKKKIKKKEKSGRLASPDDQQHLHSGEGAGKKRKRLDLSQQQDRIVGTAPKTKGRAQSYAFGGGGSDGSGGSGGSTESFGGKGKKDKFGRGGGDSLSALQGRMRAKLEGAKFRLLNEQLYTTRGDDSFQRFSAEPALFDIYHRGYREQVSKWPENPLDLIIAWVVRMHAARQSNSNSGDFVVADFGCGDAVLAQRCASPALPGCTVHSFDLVAVPIHPQPASSNFNSTKSHKNIKNKKPSSSEKSLVTACDMAHVPLPDRSVDAAVFCLSLMGTNLTDYLIEARRVLRRPHGLLKVAEVRSRLEGIEQPPLLPPGVAGEGCDLGGDQKSGGGGCSASGGLSLFVEQVESLGFQCVEKVKKNKMFVIMEFQLVESEVGKETDWAGAVGEQRSAKEKRGGKKERKREQAAAADSVAKAAAAEASLSQITAKPCIYKRR